MVLHDITTPHRDTLPVWPGHASPHTTLFRSYENGDDVQVSDLTIGLHTGTHLDAPRHFVPGGGLVTGLELPVLMGAVRVVHYTGEGPISVAFLETQNLPHPVTRLLLKCDVNAGKLDDSSFFEDYAALSPEAAAWLVERGLRLIGTDYLSIGPYHEGNREVHLTLLGASVIIVEGLDLRRVEAGDYTLVCLPLALPTDGAPCRALLMPPNTFPDPLTP